MPVNIAKICWLHRGSICALAIGALVLTGCSGPTSVARREAMSGYGAGEVSQGRAWEVVLPTREVQQREAYEDPRDAAEYARADGRLNRRDDRAQLASTQWPEARRADLSQARSITIRDRDGRFSYFDNQRWYHRDYERGWQDR